MRSYVYKERFSRFMKNKCGDTFSSKYTVIECVILQYAIHDQIMNNFVTCAAAAARIRQYPRDRSYIIFRVLQ